MDGIFIVVNITIPLPLSFAKTFPNVGVSVQYPNAATPNNSILYEAAVSAYLASTTQLLIHGSHSRKTGRQVFAPLT